MTWTLPETEAAFLAQPRLGTLMTLNRRGRPIGVPVWYEWTGEAVRMFSAKDAPKVARLRSEPYASFLVTNAVGEPEQWLAFDGRVELSDHGGIELAARLAPRYWDMADPDRVATLELWRDHPEAFCLLTLHPERIRRGR